MIQVGQNKNLGQLNTPGKKYSYKEVVTYLDNHWHSPIISLDPFKKIVLDLNASLLSIPSILISGTSGKSITSHFLTSLFNRENIKSASFTSPHFIQYNEQITISSKQINNTDFEKHATTLLNKALEHKHTLHSHELLLGILLLQAHELKADLLILEQKNVIGLDPIKMFSPRIIAITRLDTKEADLQNAITSIFSSIAPTTFVLSADQSKKNLQLFNLETQLKKAQWLMPIRKIAPLPYPFEQLHGRCASIAERIASVYITNFVTTTDETSLLHTPKKERGRPTLETQKETLLHPQKTIKQFWQESKITIPGRFQLLKTKKAPILLDCANSIDAFENLLLGIRLLSYKSSIHSIFMIVANNNHDLNQEEFIKKIKYFFKRNNGKILFCPVKNQPQNNVDSWNPEQICNIAKNAQVRSAAYPSFENAFNDAEMQSDEKSLIVITGSTEIITEYWNHKYV